MNADPKFIPRNFIFDDGFLVAKGHMMPKEINDEIMRRLDKEHEDYKRSEKNASKTRHFAATANCADRHTSSADRHDLKIVDFVMISDDCLDVEPNAKRSKELGGIRRCARLSSKPVKRYSD